MEKKQYPFTKEYRWIMLLLFFKRPKMRQRLHSTHHVGPILLFVKSGRVPLISPVFEPNLHTLSLTTSLIRTLLQNKKFASFVYKAHHTDK